MANNAEHYVNNIFLRASNDLCKFLGSRSNVRGSILHDLQVEYAYIVKNITAGPEYIAPKFVSKIESLIEKVYSFINEAKSESMSLRAEIAFPPTGRVYSWNGSIYEMVGTIK